MKPECMENRLEMDDGNAYIDENLNSDESMKRIISISLKTGTYKYREQVHLEDAAFV